MMPVTNIEMYSSKHHAEELERKKEEKRELRAMYGEEYEEQEDYYREPDDRSTPEEVKSEEPTWHRDSRDWSARDQDWYDQELSRLEDQQEGTVRDRWAEEWWDKQEKEEERWRRRGWGFEDEHEEYMYQQHVQKEFEKAVKKKFAYLEEQQRMDDLRKQEEYEKMFPPKKFDPYAFDEY